MNCSIYRSISKLALFIPVILKVKNMEAVIAIGINYDFLCIMLHNWEDLLIVLK